MKKTLLTLASLFLFGISYGKIVKFSVDMSGQVIDTNGIHITGDFQEEAGYAGGDWLPNTTEMLNEAGTNIYSVTVNIPAFAKYEFKFLNGAATYALEFVPVESRVDEVFDDNRWIYIDSLDNDTFKLAPVLFSGNAPAGLHLLRFKVDLQNETIASTGIHVNGNFQSFNDATTRLYSFDGNIFQYITYIDTVVNAAVWKFVNGNAIANEEVVPTSCANGNNMRYISVTKDTMLPVICYASCEACFPASVNGIFSAEIFSAYPNPFSEFTTIELKNSSAQSVLLLDVTGRILRNYSSVLTSIKIEKENLASGIYFLQLTKTDGTNETIKLIAE